jgi:hypothetical protein
MVKGIEKFREYFKDYSDHYVIIGGTACDFFISNAALIPRATKDIDIILIVEALSADFVKQFWSFIQSAAYERNEVGGEDRKYYRFIKPADPEFPSQIELFSRKPDMITLDVNAHLTPVPVDDDLSSLSAILLNDDYYHFMLQHSTIEDGIRMASSEALICLKARAYLDIADRIAKGSVDDSKQLRKHKTDIFRLALILAPADRFDLPDNIKEHLQWFADLVSTELPDKAIFKEMGVGNIDPNALFEQLKRNFDLR